MAPKASNEKTATQTKGFERSDHRTVGTRIAITIRMPPIVADELANLKLAQFLNHPWTDKERNQHRRQRGERRPDGKKAEDSERAKKRIELFVEQPVKQVAS